jgi:Polymerase A arginine-rich C-terminus
VEELYQEVQQAISKLFSPFFLIPRKLRTTLSSILMTQFRMTPLRKEAHKRSSSKLRIPRDPDFPFALEFLRLRATQEPALKTTWELWNEAYEA